ncbi:MAG TPA: amidohydrolase family protein, partial [Solirubrobacteraceae bacterium]|nr:amidohydrolase family protein [Solirubrobacteraceae bacterium]
EDETVDLLAAAQRSGGLVAGVVGWVDLTAPDVPDRIAGLRAAPGGERLAGIRHQVHDEPDPAAWLGRDDVRRGLRAVAAAGLVYDVLIFPPHLPATRALAEAIPQLALVLDHAAKPRIAEGAWDPWSSDLAALAEHAQVTAKLSGLVTEAPWERWREAGIERYAERLLEVFGPDRTMWGSDWPVCTLAASYADVLGLARRAVAGLDEAGRTAVLGGTATRVYGL